MSAVAIRENVQEKLDHLEVALRSHIKEHRLLEVAFESDHIGKCLLDRFGNFTKVNAACCRIWGRTEAQLLATSFQAITHPDDLDGDIEFTNALKDNSVGHYSMAKRYNLLDGTFIPCWLEVSTVLDDNGEFYMFFSKVLSMNSILSIKEELERYSV